MLKVQGSSIALKNVRKQVGDFSIINNVTFKLLPGVLVALLGPSGSGKSTLLRVIAGLESADQGEIFYYGKDVTRMPTQNRGAGMLFQTSALFNNMTVFENVAFGLNTKIQRFSNDSRREDWIIKRVNCLLALTSLKVFSKKYPYEMSGGQRQRVAFARALAIDPKVLLLDEPFSALDVRVRKKLRKWLKKIHELIPTTIVFVTHDIHEAIEMADQVIVYENGTVLHNGNRKQFVSYLRLREDLSMYPPYRV